MPRKTGKKAREQLVLGLGEKSKFYSFRQNNSGGSFIEDQNVGVLVVIEANSLGHAIKRAESVGLYFDGYGDCPCCGNRWYAPWGDNEGTDEPTDGYGRQLTKDFVKDRESGYFNTSVRIHYLDGRVTRWDRSR